MKTVISVQLSRPRANLLMLVPLWLSLWIPPRRLEMLQLAEGELQLRPLPLRMLPLPLQPQLPVVVAV